MWNDNVVIIFKYMKIEKHALVNINGMINVLL